MENEETRDKEDNNMDIKDVFRNLIMNRYMPDFDYNNTYFSFQTLHFTSAYSYCRCTCAVEHEYLDYISESGEIDEDIYKKIENCILEGKCRHVDRMPQEYIQETGIYGIHIAVARGTKEALTDPCVRIGKLFGNDPFAMAVLKNNSDILSVSNIYKAYEDWLEGHVEYVIKLSDDDHKTKDQLIGNFELCVRKENTELLTRCLHLYDFDAGFAQALEITIKDNLENMRDILIQEREKYLDSDNFELCCEIAIVYNEPVILDKLLECVGVIDDYIYYGSQDKNLVLTRLNEICIALQRDKCRDILLSVFIPKCGIPVSSQMSSATLTVWYTMEVLFRLLCRYYDALKDEIVRAFKLILNSLELTGLGDNVKVNLLHQYTSELKDEPRAFKELIKLGADVNATNSLGRTPLIDLLRFGFCHQIEFRRTAELLIFENPDLELHDSAVFHGINRDVRIYSETGAMPQNDIWVLLGPGFNDGIHSKKLKWEETLSDARLHAWAGHDNTEAFHLNFMGPFLIECGFPFSKSTCKDLDSKMETMHPAEQNFIKENQESPRLLKVCCRDSLRQHFKGRRIHRFLEQSIIPKQIKDFVLLKPLLKCIPEDLLC